jgi:hypothetical protein
MGLLQRIYKGVAALAVIHLLLLAALVGLAAVNGLLTPERIKAVVAVFRPEPPAAEAAADAAASAPSATPAPSSDATAPATLDEMARRNLERQVLEASHQLILANRQMVEVTRRREELDRRAGEMEQAREVEAQREASEAFAKDLEILSMMKAKVALESLLARPDAEAAGLLFALESRKSKAIIEAASKDPRKWARMVAIQQKMRELELPEDGESAASSGPTAAARRGTP